MREIKFRAWDKENKVMINAIFVGLGKVYGMTKTFKPSKELEDVILMQYTGLKDKNGKKIFEGDIVIASKMPYYWEFVKSVNKGLVVYNNHTASYRIKLDNYHSSTIGESDTVKFNPVSKYEVIGNIYENPELLDK